MCGENNIDWAKGGFQRIPNPTGKKRQRGWCKGEATALPFDPSEKSSTLIYNRDFGIFIQPRDTTWSVCFSA
jgi:hypothetical protein